jgi:hypothetical protein
MYSLALNGTESGGALLQSLEMLLRNLSKAFDKAQKACANSPCKWRRRRSKLLGI